MRRMLLSRFSRESAEQREARKAEKKAEKKAAKEEQAMLDAEHGLNIQLNKLNEALVFRMRGEITEALGPDAVAIRTALAKEAGKKVDNYLSSLGEEHGKILELEKDLLSKTNNVYNAHERQALVAGDYKAHQQNLRKQSGGRRRSRYSRRRRKTKKRKPKTRKRKRLGRKRRSR